MSAELSGLRGKEAELLAKAPLMPGWEQIDDPEHDAYYYNGTTGETTYERPAMPADKGRVRGSAKPSEAQSVQEAAQAEKEARDFAREMEEAVTHAGKRREQAQQQLDFAEQTAQQSASQIQLAQANAAGEAKALAAAREREAAALASPLLLAPLPADWEEINDDDAGVYYYNRATGESAYERPAPAGGPKWEKPAAVVEAEKALKAASDANQYARDIEEATGKSANKKQRAAEELAAAELAATENRGQAKAAKKAAAEAQARLAAAREKEAEVLSSAALRGPLLAGWEEVDDPGGVYYYHASTGESAWERPEEEGRSGRASSGEKPAAVLEAERTSQQAAGT